MTSSHPGLQELVQRRMSSVEFVRDYLQLRFEGPCLSVFTTLAAGTDGRIVSRDQPGFAELLISMIGARVERAEALDGERIEIALSGERLLSIELRDEDRAGAEAAA